MGRESERRWSALLASPATASLARYPPPTPLFLFFFEYFVVFNALLSARSTSSGVSQPG